MSNWLVTSVEKLSVISHLFDGLGVQTDRGKHDSFDISSGDSSQKLGVYANVSYTGPDSF